MDRRGRTQASKEESASTGFEPLTTGAALAAYVSSYQWEMSKCHCRIRALAPTPMPPALKLVPKKEEPMTFEDQEVATRHLAMLEATEQIAQDFVTRMMQLRDDPTSGTTVLQLVNGVPARLLT